MYPLWEWLKDTSVSSTFPGEYKRVTNTQKKQRKTDSKGEERKIRCSPYVTPVQYERDIDISAHLQFYCLQEPKINVNVPPLGMA